jgi:molybdopterin/thiamine biosynthesis adenylyltransferase
MAELTGEQRKRYARQLGLPEVGEAGQRKLAAARVLVVGAGGLGSPVILYLAAAGVGALGICDGDSVDVSNLQRQILHDTQHIGASKTASAAERAKALNPDVNVVRFSQRITADNVSAVARDYDMVVDCTDNFPIRYLLNDICIAQSKPLVHGSVFEFEGQASTFIPGQGPCYRCLFPQAPPDELCGGPGPMIFPPAPGVIGVIQAAEVLKLILGAGDTLAGRLLLVDTLKMRFKELNVKRDPACVSCGENPGVKRLNHDT